MDAYHGVGEGLDPQYLRQPYHSVAVEAGGEGGYTPRAALSRERHFKEHKNFRHVHGCLNALHFTRTSLDIRPPGEFCDV